MAITEKKHIFSGIVTLVVGYYIKIAICNFELFLKQKMECFFLKFSAIYSDLVGHLRFLGICYFNVNITGTFFTTLF